MLSQSSLVWYTNAVNVCNIADDISSVPMRWLALDLLLNLKDTNCIVWHNLFPIIKDLQPHTFYDQLQCLLSGASTGSWAESQSDAKNQIIYNVYVNVPVWYLREPLKPKVEYECYFMV